jgi:hypothetical protein
VDGWAREFVEWATEGLNEIEGTDTQVREGAIECRCKCLHSTTFCHYITPVY